MTKNSSDSQGPIDLPEFMQLYDQSICRYEQIERNNARRVSVNGIAMGYLEFGSREGIPIIWAHGSSCTGYEVINVQEGLVEAGYRVISIDYRGHGKTQIETTKYNTSIYHIADDIAGLMDHLGIAKAIVGGLSKGGFVATAFYDTYPKRVLGLLLEDGGTWSHLRFKEDVRLKLVRPGPLPYTIGAYKKLCDPSSRFKNRYDAFKAVWKFSSVAVENNFTLEYFTYMLSLLRHEQGDTWRYHCDGLRLMTGDEEPEYSIEDITLYSKLPLMQQSQELMIPLVVFRNLDVPVHIIDPDCPTDWLPVRYQNEELRALHPDLIVHEVYEYEYSPHEAHLQRPDRFIASAKALLTRVKLLLEST